MQHLRYSANIAGNFCGPTTYNGSLSTCIESTAWILVHNSRMRFPAVWQACSQATGGRKGVCGEGEIVFGRRNQKFAITCLLSKECTRNVAPDEDGCGAFF